MDEDIPGIPESLEQRTSEDSGDMGGSCEDEPPPPRKMDPNLITKLATELSYGPELLAGQRRPAVRPKREVEVTTENVRVRLELDIDTIERMHDLFKEQERQEGRGVTEKVFKDFLAKANMKKEVAEHMFDKVDWASMGEVTWDEFCTYMQLKMGKEEELHQLSQVIQFLPACENRLPHREACIGVGVTQDGMWITTSIESLISLWTKGAFLKRYRKCISQFRVKNFKPKWVTCMCVASEYSKVILGTGDREVQFFDMASFGPHCQINGLDTVPMSIHFRCPKGRRDQAILVYGDQQGCVGIMKFVALARSLRCWKKLHKHEDYIGSISLDQTIMDHDVLFTRWQVHRDWVNMVRFYPETDQVCSCSKDNRTPLVLANRRGSTHVPRALKDYEKVRAGKLLGAYSCTRSRLACDQLVFHVVTGVHCFDFSPSLKLLASGGLDRVVRVWNCFINKAPVARLSGHYTPISFLFFCAPTGRLFSISRDKWVKVWDVFDFLCLATVPYHVHRVRGHLKSAVYNPRTQSVAIVGDNIGILRVKTREEAVKSHKTAVTCIVYNPAFNHLISASANSEVRVWDLDTGKLEFEFGNAHGECGISDMVLDKTGKRLITAGRDGKGKIWNYNNGHCLHQLERPADRRSEMSTVLYIDMRVARFIMLAGWTHRLNFYHDSLESIPFELSRLPTWLDEKKRGHTGDVLCSDFCAPEKLATGGYDGRLIVWSMETSARTHLFVPDPPEGWSQAKLASDCGVSCLMFLQTRVRRKLAGTLVSAGPYGHIYFWSITRNICLASFPAYDEDEEKADEVVNVAALDCDEKNVTLVTGDSRGYVTIWNVNAYGSFQINTVPPPVIVTWQAHLEPITAVKFVEPHPLLVTCSTDCTIRLWNMQGHYIGTFGHHRNWQLDDEQTFRHPEVPSDIWEANLPPDWEEMKLKDATKVPSFSESDWAALDPESRKRLERYDLGLAYFARQKANVRRRKHLNDEAMKCYSCVGNVALYHNLRCHPLVRPPHANAEKPKVWRSTLDFKKTS